MHWVDVGVNGIDGGVRLLVVGRDESLVSLDGHAQPEAAAPGCARLPAHRAPAAAPQTLGNHEFDDGVANLADFIRNASFPVLSCNLDTSAEPLLDGLVEVRAIVRVCVGRGGDGYLRWACQIPVFDHGVVYDRCKAGLANHYNFIGLPLQLAMPPPLPPPTCQPAHTAALHHCRAAAQRAAGWRGGADHRGDA